jgi:hypothetical protein
MFGLRYFRTTLLIVAAAGAGACSDDTTAPAGSGVVSVELRAPNDSLFLGRAMQLVAVALGDSAAVTRPTITWSSSDTLAVVVNANGLVTAVGTGNATITAAVADQQAQFVVRAMPMRVAPDGMLATAAPSHAHTFCALTPAGHAACLVPPTAPDTVPHFSLLPDASNHVFTQFSTGFDSDCGLKADGSIWCTRSPGYLLATRAELGTLTTFRPVRTPERFSELSVGGHTHLCAVGRDDGLARCWGHAHIGVLGRPLAFPNQSEDSLIVPVVAAPPLSAVSANQSITCALNAAGRPVCWGGSARGKGMRALPDTSAPGLGNDNQWYARTRDDTPPFVEIKQDDDFICGRTAEGIVHCWGGNGDGQLGIGSTAASTSVERVASDVPFRTMHTVYFQQSQICALSTADDLYCWGRIDPAPLRDALGARRYRPVPLIRGIPLQGMMLGLNRRCAVTRAGGAVCW